MILYFKLVTSKHGNNYCKNKKESKAAFTKDLLKSFDFLEIQEEKKTAPHPPISKKKQGCFGERV